MSPEVPSGEEIARRKIRGHIESYILQHGDEDSQNRVVGSLGAHDPARIETVFEQYTESWESRPDVELEKLRQLKRRLRLEYPQLNI